jgi:hypothetical protein
MDWIKGRYWHYLSRRSFIINKIIEKRNEFKKSRGKYLYPFGLWLFLSRKQRVLCLLNPLGVPKLFVMVWESVTSLRRTYLILANPKWWIDPYELLESNRENNGGL